MIPSLSSTFLLSIVLASLLILTSAAPSRPIHPKREVSFNLYLDFVRYIKYSNAVHATSCPNPLGNTLVLPINDALSDTQGFIARDDSRKEIVVSFRGSTSAIDFLVDLKFNLVRYNPKAVPAEFLSSTAGAEVHDGFLFAHNRVAQLIVDAFSEQLRAYPSYTLVSTGHSLGAALASLMGLTLKANFPETPLKIYAYGQSRIGNEKYADLIEKTIGVDNIFRVVHTNDIIPHLPPTSFGFQHHGVEYWNYEDPASPEVVHKCIGREDPSCSKSAGFIEPTGTNIDGVSAHLIYFGIRLGFGTDELCR